ncbi:MAG: leucine-rich repeat protein [Muribaculaceae bacterium]|nr:leucine-rich repeat protein [Muribaculaceae bacterium]
MKKLPFFKLLALVACLSSALSASAYDFYTGGIYYKITSSNSVKVTFKTQASIENSSAYSGSVYIPSTVYYDGISYSVTAIDDFAFYCCYNLTSVSIPNAIYYIGQYAFYNCESLTSITIPNSVTSLNNYGIFIGCTSLKTVTLGFGVESIGNNAFYNCSQLTTINAHPITPPTITSSTFDSKHYQQVTVNLYARAQSAYKSANYWSNFSSVQNQALKSCDFSAKPLNYDKLFYWAVVGPYALEVSYKDTNYNSYTESTYTIPEYIEYGFENWYVTGIGHDAFRNCTNVQTVNFANNTRVTKIDDYAFYGCTNLSSFSFSSYHGNGGARVTTIGYEAFERCTSLTQIDFPSSLTSLGQYAFYNCPLSKIKVYTSTPPTASNYTFYNSSPSIYNTCQVSVPGPGAISKYKAATGWSNFTNYTSTWPYDFYYNGIYYAITGTNTVAVAPSDWFQHHDYVGDVVIPATVPYNGVTYRVTEIADEAFSQFQQVNLNGSGDAAPRASGTLTSVTIGSNVTKIGKKAFYLASGMTNITIPNNVTTIGSEAFIYCSGLKSVTLGTGVTSIGADAFSGCTALTEVRSNRATPPTIQNTTFTSSHYTNATLYVPNTTAINNYKAANYWKNFNLILPSNMTPLDYALRGSSSNVTPNFSSVGDYPWTVKTDGTRVYAQSGNAGVASSTSTLTSQVNLIQAKIISFEFKAWGEGTSYDKCIFAIDGVEMFSYGARDNDWETYTANIPAGTHTLTWIYQKDGSVNPTGDYFAVDNVVFTDVPIATGDVDGDGKVNIDDVTSLIDLLLAGATPPAAADVDGDGKVNIADVTALIDMLLGR